MMQVSKKYQALFLLTLLLFFVSCTNTSEKEQKELDERLGNWAKEIKNPQYYNLLETHIKKNFVQNDTLLLGYVLGWNEKQVLEHTNLLISEGTISPLQKQIIPTFTVGKSFTAKDTISTWRGYNYSFQMDTISKCDGFINFAYDQKVLSHVRLFIMSQFSLNEIEKFIEKRYGKPVYETNMTENDYEYPKKIFIWLSGGKEIQLCEWLNYSYIQYSNIKYRFEDEKSEVQSRQQEIKNDSLEKERLKKESEKSPKVF